MELLDEELRWAEDVIDCTLWQIDIAVRKERSADVIEGDRVGLNKTAVARADTFAIVTAIAKATAMAVWESSAAGEDQQPDRHQPNCPVYSHHLHYSMPNEFLVYQRLMWV